jgi:hypothetical protein
MRLPENFAPPFFKKMESKIGEQKKEARTKMYGKKRDEEERKREREKQSRRMN